jgi:predicted NBD/HSP70 family sugar kinase
MILSSLIARGEALAGEQLQKKMQEVATALRTVFGSAAVTVEDGRVIVGGRGLVKRWLNDPAVRFLSGGIR